MIVNNMSLFFENPFENYSKETCLPLLEPSKLEQKWKATITQLQELNSRDYSVYTGTTGIALLKLKRDPENRQNLQEARDLLSLNRLKKSRVSFLCGDVGPLAIGAVIDYKLGNNTLNCVEGIKALSGEVFDTNCDLPNELLYGRAGYLFGVLFVNKNVSPPPFDDAFIRKIIECIFICGKNEARAGKFKCPLMYQWHDSYYLGAAHGVAGILYLLLQVKQYLTETELQGLIKPTIEYLSSLRFPSRNFPSSIGRDVDSKVQWCHGAPGFVFLYCQAYKVFGDAKYLQIAIDCGEVVWERGILTKGYSICHGVAGNAYSFLQLYQTTNDEKHLYRALKFSEWCLDYHKSREGHSPDRPQSLFEGIAGPMYMLLDIQKPSDAKFPGFTL